MKHVQQLRIRSKPRPAKRSTVSRAIGRSSRRCRHGWMRVRIVSSHVQTTGPDVSAHSATRASRWRRFERDVGTSACWPRRVPRRGMRSVPRGDGRRRACARVRRGVRRRHGACLPGVRRGRFCARGAPQVRLVPDDGTQCLYCGEPVVEEQYYVIPNRHEDPPEWWGFAHFECYEPHIVCWQNRSLRRAYRADRS